MGHKILEIKISNYKSIVSEIFELSDFTPLVGYNNAGKSNILNAIKWLLRKSSLGVEAFYDENAPIVIEGKISGIDEALLSSITQAHRTSIEPYILSEEIRIKRIQNAPGDTAANIKLFLFKPTATTPETEWVANPTGIDNAIAALFPEPIQIGAMENAEEDVSKSKATTTIGKLLAEIIGPIEAQYGANVQTALEGLKNILDAEGINRAPELIQFDTDVNAKIDNFFPTFKSNCMYLLQNFGMCSVRVPLGYTNHTALQEGIFLHWGMALNDPFKWRLLGIWPKLNEPLKITPRPHCY